MTAASKSGTPEPLCDFYVVGGTVGLQAQSYVERQSDRGLYDGLSSGEFCYLLTARQMGKSSLMVRVAARLGEAGAAVAIIDLTSIGLNLSPEQWYAGLLLRLGQQLNLEDEIAALWRSWPEIGPLLRWSLAMRRVLALVAPAKLAVFVDEIDAVRSLTFETDEFFAAIRELYNSRSESSDLRRLTFCLLGVASPSDLIADPRTTPFNIGRRIEVEDFKHTEAMPLMQGLGREESKARELLGRILYWTGGHPYLTQQFCRAVAGRPEIMSPDDVDRLSKEIFISPQGQTTNDNLLFVRDRILRGGGDLAGLLGLYQRIWGGANVPDDKGNPLASLLLLAGIVRSEKGRLVIRNEIYRHVFNDKWVSTNMPDVEARRQRAAFWRGVIRSAVITIPVLALITVLAILALRGYRQASAQRGVAEAGRATNRRLLYSAEMNLAQQAWESGHIGALMRLLQAQRPPPGEEDLRGFEWYYLWRQCHRDLATLQHPAPVNSVAFSPDGEVLATGSEDGVARLWSPTTKAESAELHCHAAIKCVAFSPDSRILATADADRTVKLWDVETGGEIRTLLGHQNVVEAAAFSSDGWYLATGGADGVVMIWEVRSFQNGEPRAKRFRRSAVRSVARSRGAGHIHQSSESSSATLKDETVSSVPILTIECRTGPVYSVEFSPDSTMLGIGSRKALKLWSLPSRRLITLHEQTDDTSAEVYSLSFAPDGHTLAATRHDETLIWDLPTGRSRLTLAGPHGAATAVALAPTGKSIATGAQDGMVELRDLTSGGAILALRGHTDSVLSVAFSPNGRVLATASADHTAKLWELSPGQDEALTLAGHSREILSTAFSPTERLMVTGASDMTARIWDLTTGSQLGAINPFANTVLAVAVSPDGRTLATAGDRISLWHVPDGTKIAELWQSTSHEAEGVDGLAFSPNGRLLAAGNRDRFVMVYDLATGRRTSTFGPHGGGVLSVAFSTDSSILASCSTTEVKLWDVKNGSQLASTAGHEELANSVLSKPDSDFAAASLWVADYDGFRYRASGRTEDVRTSIARSEGWHEFVMSVDDRGYHAFIDGTHVLDDSNLLGFTDIQLLVNAPAWRPDAACYFDDLRITDPSGDLLYYDDFEGDKISGFWDVEQQFGTASVSTAKSHGGSRSVKLETEKGGPRWIQLSHHFASSLRGTLSVWFFDSAAGRETVYVHVIVTDDSASRRTVHTALSPNARLLALARQEDSTVKIQNLSTGDQIATLQSHAGPIRSLAFSPDGRRLASGSDDKTVKLWDVATWREVATFKGYQSAVTMIKFSPDGRVRATQSADNLLRVWTAWDP